MGTDPQNRKNHSFLISIVWVSHFTRIRRYISKIYDNNVTPSTEKFIKIQKEYLSCKNKRFSLLVYLLCMNNFRPRDFFFFCVCWTISVFRSMCDRVVPSCDGFVNIIGEPFSSCFSPIVIPNLRLNSVQKVIHTLRTLPLSLPELIQISNII